MIKLGHHVIDEKLKIENFPKVTKIIRGGCKITHTFKLLDYLENIFFNILISLPLFLSSLYLSFLIGSYSSFETHFPTSNVTSCAILSLL
jgi:hypothetical protein